jgi:hypothetical protein
MSRPTFLGGGEELTKVQARTAGYGLGFPVIRCGGGDFTTVLEVAYVRSTDRNCMIFLSYYYYLLRIKKKKLSKHYTSRPLYIPARPPDFNY